MTKVSPAINAAAFERTPMVTSTASQTTPANVANSLGWNVVCASASNPPPMPAMPAANRPRNHLHLHDADARRPRAPASLQRAALSASPVVDRRKLTMKKRDDDEGHQTEVREGEVGRGEAGAVEVEPETLVHEAGQVKTRFSMRSPKVSVTRAT